MNDSLYVTTAIPYVNGAPHLGFALELVLADTLARHARSRGRDVRLVTGADENSLKNVRAAEAVGVTTAALVEANAARFRALGPLLDLSFDDFVRTSADARHVAAVRAVWEACARAGDLEKRAYRGLYCVGCERFFDPGEDPSCPEHPGPLEPIEEENWFFRLSRYEARVREALAAGTLRIEPPERAREVARFLERGLVDVSVSRSRQRARGWGIEVPGDPEQVIYVWFDALVYYLSSLGYPEKEGLYRRYWESDGARIQSIGKGITRFHAVLWPAILASIGAPLPTVLWVHGYVTERGEKIGKSGRSGLDPSALVARHGADAVRYFLLRHVGPARDADVDEERFARVYAAELADGLGNLVARTLTLARRAPAAASAPEIGIDAEGERLAARAGALDAEVDQAIARLAPDVALRAIWALADACDKHLAATAPWALAKSESPEARARGAAVVHHVLAAIGAIARALAPFLPATAATIARALSDDAYPVPILFPKERGPTGALRESA